MKRAFVAELVRDLGVILMEASALARIVIATTVENDTQIQDQLQSVPTFNHFSTVIEFWSWSKISNSVFLYPALLHKYFPFRQGQVELTRITVLNRSVYKKSSGNELLYYYQNIRNRNHLPIFDFSFINNSENTVTLNSVAAYTVHQEVVRAGLPPVSAGILKPTKRYIIDLKLGTNIGEYDLTLLDFDDPLFVLPKAALRIQLQNRKPIINFHKIYFVFYFNSMKLRTPELYFNSFTTFSGILHNEI